MKKLTIKELPDSKRPYEKCLKSGPEHLSDAELLAIILRTGSKEENSLGLAQRILSLHSSGESLLGLMHLTLPELMAIKGVGPVKGIQLLCIGAVSYTHLDVYKRQVYGREIAGNLLPVKAEESHISVHGFIGKPVIARSNRNFENYYINGRYIKSNIIAVSYTHLDVYKRQAVWM